MGFAGGTAPSSLNKMPSSSYSLEAGLPRRHKKFLSRKFDLHQQYTCLDLLTSAFSEVIEDISKSKPDLGRLLGRVRGSYKKLFTRLIDNVVQNQKEFGCE